MGHAPSPVARLAPILATTLAAACSSPTDTPPPPPPLAQATLAFTADSSIYVISTDTGATASLLVSGFIQPSWSPDGGTLAMVATGAPRVLGFPPDQSLYLADADGSNARELTDFDWPITAQALWSPDGATLLFLRSRSFPSSTSVLRVAAAGGPESYVSVVTYAAVPSWSHDGTLVALDLGGTVYLVDAAGSDTILTLAAQSPRFSPVNDDMAFREPTTGHIHLIRPDSSADRDLHVEGYPQSWSPDGKRIAFVGNGGVYTIKPDGSDLLRVGPLNVEVSDLAWSADGQRIAYVVSTSSGPESIYLARSDDSDAKPIFTAEAVCCLSWRP